MERLTKLSRSVVGRRVLITGAGSGMGRATAYLFADEGAHIVAADRDAERVTAVVDEIASRYPNLAVFGLVADVGDRSAAGELVNSSAKLLGGIDILVNNAGVSLVTSAFQDEDSFEENWAATLAINLTAHARLVRRCVPFLQEHGSGRIVNIASTEAIVTTAGIAAYAASKSGVVGLTKSFAVELGRQGITVNCICPGPINTGMTVGIDDEAKATYARRRVPLRRYGEPEEVAQMVLNLCLPSSSFVNGAVVTVDGGMSIRHT
jgi:3-oxoacyl-[acyl-carrier protein] reductase